MLSYERTMTYRLWREPPGDSAASSGDTPANVFRLGRVHAVRLDDGVATQHTLCGREHTGRLVQRTWDEVLTVTACPDCAELLATVCPLQGRVPLQRNPAKDT